MRAQPSPAMVIAFLALLAALGGSAIAGVATSALSKGDKKQVKKLAKKQARKQLAEADPEVEWHIAIDEALQGKGST